MKNFKTLLIVYILKLVASFCAIYIGWNWIIVDLTLYNEITLKQSFFALILMSFIFEPVKYDKLDDY